MERGFVTLLILYNLESNQPVVWIYYKADESRTRKRPQCCENGELGKAIERYADVESSSVCLRARDAGGPSTCSARLLIFPSSCPLDLHTGVVQGPERKLVVEGQKHRV